MYYLVSFLEEGSFGHIYEGEKDSNKVAVKRVLVPNRYKNYVGVLWIREMDIMGRLKHKYINTWKTIEFDNPFNAKLPSPRKFKTDYYIIQEYANGKTLHEQIQDYSLPISYVKRMMYQILAGLYYMHQNGIYHGDIKPDNILCHFMNNVPDIRITDFGFSNFVGRINDFELGNETYQAPEVLMESMDINCKLDIWATACIFFEMIAKARLFSGKSQREILRNILEIRGLPPSIVMKKILGKRKLKFLPRKTYRKGIRDVMKLNEDEIKTFNKKMVVSLRNFGSYDDFCKLMEKMLEFDKDRRYTSKECIDHDFFKEIPLKDHHDFLGLVKQKDISIEYHNLEMSNNQEGRKSGLEVIEDLNDLEKEFMWRILFQAVDIYERCLLTNVSTNYKLLAVSCGYIAAKYFLSRRTTSIKKLYPSMRIKIPDIIAMEKLVLKSLNYKIYRITVYDLLSKEYKDDELLELFEIITDQRMSGNNIKEIAKEFEENV